MAKWYTKPPAGTPLIAGHPHLDNLLGWWPMLEGAGGTVYNYGSAVNADGVIGGPSITWLPGQFGRTLDFGDTAEVGVDVGNPSGLKGLSSASIMLWVNIRKDNVDNDLVVKGSHAGSEPFVLWFDYTSSPSSSRRWAFLITDTGGTYSGVKYSAAQAITGEWVHLALVFVGGSHVNLYINGELDANSPFDMTGVDDISDDAKNWNIGTDSTPTAGRLDGQADDVRIYASALTIQDIMHNPFAAFYKRTYASLYVTPAGIYVPQSLMTI